MQAASVPSGLTTLLQNGDDHACYVWVVVSEGYTAEQESAFHEDARSLVRGMLSQSPFSEYRAALNVYALFQASLMSGADFPPDVYVDTAFDAAFLSAGLDRLLTVNEAAVLSAAAGAVPHFDLVIVLVNEEHYGGSGGSVIVVSVHEHMHEVALHEAGHVIAGLADEYTAPYPGYPAGDGEPNVTFENDLYAIPWKHWIASSTPVPTPEWHDEEIGLFEGARYRSSGIYRPTLDSKMRHLGRPFYAVNTEALVLGFYGYTDVITEALPQKSLIELVRGEQVVLKVKTILGDNTGSLDVMWLLDDEVLEYEDGTELLLAPSDFLAGQHSVTVRVRDNTGLVRTDAQGLTVSERSWTVTKSFCSGSVVVICKDAESGSSVGGVSLTIAEAGGVSEETTGICRIQGLSCGLHAVSSEAEGYRDGVASVFVTDGAAAETVLLLEPDERAGYVRGRIMGRLPGEVQIEVSGPLNRTATTDSAGIYSLGPVPPGTYLLTPRGSGQTFFPPSRRIVIRPDETTSCIFIALPGETRSGSVD